MLLVCSVALRLDLRGARFDPRERRARLVPLDYELRGLGLCFSLSARGNVSVDRLGDGRDRLCAFHVAATLFCTPAGRRDRSLREAQGVVRRAVVVGRPKRRFALYSTGCDCAQPYAAFGRLTIAKFQTRLWFAD
jgi:hypothetical protein